MADSDKLRIKPLQSGDNYRLWRIRIEAACDAKNLDDVLNRERNPHSDPDKKAKFAGDMRKASGIIVAALSNEPLRIVRSEIRKPYSMIKKLNERYDSKSAASCISKMTELISLRYDSLSKDIGGHIDKMAGIVEQLADMDTSIPDELAIALLIASINVFEMAPIAAAIKTMPDDSADWGSVTTRLIEEQHSIRIKMKPERTAKATRRCEICGKTHFTKDCWLNPKNPNNRLQLKERPGKDSKGKRYFNKSEKESDEKKRDQSRPKTPRAAVARANVCNNAAHRRRMMLDSGTTTHMTPDEDELFSTVNCNVSISLGDDSCVQASCKGTNAVTWSGLEGTTEVHLSETLAARDLAMKLLSVPALTKKGMAVLFLPSKTLIVDLRENYKVIGVSHREDDGLYYIGMDGSDHAGTSLSTTDRAMKALARQFTESDETSDIDSSLSIDDACSTQYEDGDTSDEHNDDEYINSDTEDCYSSQTNESDDELPSDDSEVNLCVMAKATESDGAIWHKRLEHHGTPIELRDMMNSGTLPPVKQTAEGCDPCMKGKFKRFFRGSLTKESQPGKIHADLVGRVKPRSVDGYEYFLTIIDEATRYADTRPLEKKSDASPALLSFMKRFERQAGVKLRALHTDDGSEFFKARGEFEELGVKITTSTAYTPTSNGLIERTQGVLLSYARSCLEQARLPLTYWTHALEHVTKGRNVIVHSATGKPPYTDIFGHSAEYVKHMRPFGCRVLFQRVQKKLEKFEGRLREGICLGNLDGGIYKVLTSTGIVKTKHVRFFESTFHGKSLLDKQNSTATTLDGHSNTVLEIDDYISDSQENNAVFFNIGEHTDVTMLGGEENVPANIDEAGHTDTPNLAITEEQFEQLTHYPAKPSSFRDSDSDDDEDSDNARGDPSWTPSANAALPHDITTCDEPTLAVAMKSPEANEWQNAIVEEFKTLEKAGTWIKQKTSTKNVLPTGMVLRLKRDEHGLPSKFKARLVARGNLQRNGDYTQENRYAPVASFDLVRILVALSASFGWKRHQKDVKGAFLHSRLPIDTDIWIKLSKIDGIPAADGSVVKLVKSLYGLREAPKLWYQTLSARLIEMGGKRIAVSDCLFMMEKHGSMALILIYVDDLGMFGDEKVIMFVKAKLGKYLKLTDLGESTFFLGVLIRETEKTIILTQKPLIKRIMQLSNMETCKPAKTPLPISHVLYEARSEPTKDEEQSMKMVPYKEVLGSLLFLSTSTRPDISTAVSMLGKFAASPLPRHWNAMKHVIRYLSGTQDYGLVFKKKCGHDLGAWSDAEWARDEHKRRSRSGILITIGSNPVIWTSKLQPSVALSTTEAEFYALSECIREVNWVRQLFIELDIEMSSPTPVQQDKLGAIKWTKEVQGLRNVKHVRIRYHFVKEAVQRKDVEVVYTPSVENKADPLTKVLGGSLFDTHRKEQNVMSSSEGGRVTY